LPKTNTEQPVFTVPEGYFENFAASVLAKIRSQPSVPAADELAELSPVLAAIPKRQPYHVPEDYFQHLATGLPALVNDGEALPDLLQNHTKQMPFTVPDGYFDGLAAQVAAKVAKPQAKVVRLRFMRYAAAAIVIGLIALTGLFYWKRTGSVVPDPDKQPDVWVAQKLKNIPKQDIEAFLKNVDTGHNSRELAQKGGKADVQALLRDVSTTELDAFLKELPADVHFTHMN
jgi:hypothetical protein